MNTVTLQINNEKAYRLIEDVEALNIVKVIRRSGGKVKKKLSEKFAGVLKT